MEEKQNVVDTKIDDNVSKTQSSTQNTSQNSIMFNLWNRKMTELYQRNASVEELGKAFGNVMAKNPDLRNMVLKNLKTLPYLPSRDDIENALTDPRNNEQMLRAIGGNLLTNCYPMYKLVRFYEGILTYRWQLIPQNINVQGMKKPRFQNEQKFINKWLKKLNPEYQLRRIVQETLQSGKRAYFLRELFSESKLDQEVLDEGITPTVDNYTRKVVSVRLEDLPDDYVKIVGRSNQSYYTIAFDFTYFYSQTGVDIENYPPVFKKLYKKISKFMVNKDGKAHIKDIELAKNFSSLHKFSVSNTDNKFGECYNYWVDIPSDECQVFSADESTPLQAPNFLGLYLMCSDLQVYNMLQQQLTSVPLYSLIIGQIPMDKENKNIALSPNDIDHYRDAVASVLPPGVSFAMTPSQDNKSIVFDELPNSNKIYMSALQGLVGTAGMSGILSTTDKPNLSQNKISQLTEKRFVDVFYEQFKDFINRHLEKMTNLGLLRYDWQIDIYGDIFSDKEEKESLLKGISQGLTTLLPRYFSYYGYTVDDAVALANQVDASGIYDMLKPLVSTFQQSGNDGTKKDKDEDKIDNDNTAKSKEQGTNKNENRISFNNQLEVENLQNQLKEVKEILLNFIEERGE